MAAWGQAKVSEAAAMPYVSLQCWGDFALADCITDADLKPRGRKARALLAYLALHAGKSISRERLTGLLWGDRGEEQARASLRQAILELKPLSGDERGVICVERDHLTLRPGTLTTDADRMRAAVEAGDYAGLVGLIPDSDERLFANLDGLDEAFDEWLMLERSRQSEALITLIADASAAALSQGQMRAARTLHARRCEWAPGTAALPPTPDLPPPPVAPEERLASVAPLHTGRVGSRWAPIALVLGSLCLLAVAAAYWLNRPAANTKEPTIAVLPFSGIAPENASFAKGLSEEITSQLARQSGLRVAGRTSAAQLRAQSADLHQIGRRLRVGYILEGSVRSVGDRVRVNVALTKTSDGLQLWAETFDGTLDDILAIQYRIGANVARALTQKLATGGPPTGSMITKGEVYSLYLTARGLIRERNPQAVLRARSLLERTVALDPSFAPGWSSLAQVEYPGGDAPDSAAMTNRAIGYAQRALELAPDLAEAHGVLGMIYGFDHPLGWQHIKRAAALDPNNAEYQYWLGNVYGEQVEFVPMLEAYRRAFALDPLWTRPQNYLVQMAWAMGYQGEARSVARRVESDGSAAQAHEMRATIAQSAGDLSGAVQELRLARDTATNPGRKAAVDWHRAMVLQQLRLYDASYAIRRRWREKLPPTANDPYVAIMTGNLPTSAQFEQRSRNVRYSWRDTGYVGRAAKMLLNAGRAPDVVQAYDRGGLLQRSPTGLNITSRLFEDGPVVAAALRAVGRRQEADQLLAQLDREIGLAERRSGGRLPARFLAMAAGTRAMVGKQQQALSALEKASSLGWLYVADMDDSSLPDIGDEPAFRPLRGAPRFEAVRKHINTSLARERREVIAAGTQTI